MSESIITIFEVTLRSERMENLKGTNGNYPGWWKYDTAIFCGYIELHTYQASWKIYSECVY